jgi:copper(I)-binding protein
MKRLAILFACTLAACDREQAAPDLKLSGGWARETVAGQKTGAAYLTIVNNGAGSDRLVGLSSDAAKHVMLHSTSAEDGVARMRHLHDGLAIPSKAAVELTPGRTHIMLEGLKAPLQRGQAFTLNLDFERSPDRSVDVKVLDPAAAGLQGAR